MQILQWLEKYRSEKMDRTPAKTPSRKGKRELDGTPKTPHSPSSPSSDSDMMSPPPIKRTKSRRGLGPLMEQHQNEILENRSAVSYLRYPSQNQSHHHQGDENVYICTSNSNYGDENKYQHDYSHVQHCPVPSLPPIHNRTVLRNTENILRTPTKNIHGSYHGFDMEGIKPLIEVEETGYTNSSISNFINSNSTFSHHSNQQSTITVHEPEVLLEYPSSIHMALPKTLPDQILEGDNLIELPWIHLDQTPLKRNQEGFKLIFP